MIWTVAYKPSAEQELARLWNDAPDRAAVTDAANQIDALLKVDPLTQGESRSGTTRILFVPPLAVLFEVSEDDRYVDVLQVWRIPPLN
jgi:hypothetical protein